MYGFWPGDVGVRDTILARTTPNRVRRAPGADDESLQLARSIQCGLSDANDRGQSDTRPAGGYLYECLDQVPLIAPCMCTNSSRLVRDTRATNGICAPGDRFV